MNETMIDIQLSSFKVELNESSLSILQILRKLRKDRTEFEDFITYLMWSYGLDESGRIKTPLKDKASVKDETKEKIIKTVKSLNSLEVTILTMTLKNTFDNALNNNSTLFKISPDFPNIEKIKQQVIDSPTDGHSFSARATIGNTKLANSLKKLMTELIKGKKTITQCSKELQRLYDMKAYESDRLMRTEMTRVYNAANDIYAKAIGIEEQIYMATLEKNTCEECASHDGEHYDIDDTLKPTLPLHPNCRCLYINVPYKGWNPSARMNNDTKTIEDYKTFKTI